MKARVHVTLKSGVLDPQGAAVRHALGSLRKDVTGMNPPDDVERQIAMAGKEDVFLFDGKASTDTNGFLAATHVDAADNLALAVQLALDAVFNFPHQGHIVQELACETGVRLSTRRG
jgi:hypothetical protein